MTRPAEQLLEEALALPAKARAMLAERLVESLDPRDDDSVREAWTAEALRRRDEVRSGKVRTVSAETSRARIERLLRP
ncbi:MAG: addiction module protein [Lysobacteraceae bacterium]